MNDKFRFVAIDTAADDIVGNAVTQEELENTLRLDAEDGDLDDIHQDIVIYRAIAVVNFNRQLEIVAIPEEKPVDISRDNIPSR